MPVAVYESALEQAKNDLTDATREFESVRIRKELMEKLLDALTQLTSHLNPQDEPPAVPVAVVHEAPATEVPAEAEEAAHEVSTTGAPEEAAHEVVAAMAHEGTEAAQDEAHSRQEG